MIVAMDLVVEGVVIRIIVIEVFQYSSLLTRCVTLFIHSVMKVPEILCYSHLTHIFISEHVYLHLAQVEYRVRVAYGTISMLDASRKSPGGIYCELRPQIHGWPYTAHNTETKQPTVA